MTTGTGTVPPCTSKLFYAPKKLTSTMLAGYREIRKQNKLFRTY